MKEELDEETKEVEKEGRETEELIKSAGWKRAKKKLFNKLASIDSISLLPDNMPTAQMIFEVKVRQASQALIIEWVREIEGIANQYKDTKEAIKELRQESPIKYFDV